MGKKKKQIKPDEIKETKTRFTGSRHLILSEELNEDFNSIKLFKNFDRWFFHKFDHVFYSLSIAYSAKQLFSSPDLLNDAKFEETRLVKKGEEKKPTIESTQLIHHDDLFKTIAYWYLLQKGDPKPYLVLVNPNLARQICEGFFIYKWNEFRKMISNFKSTHPNVDIAKILGEN